MKLLKNLPTRKDKNGNTISWGLFLCVDCNTEVERQISNGLKQANCGCNKNKGKNNYMYGKLGKDNPNFGKIRTQEHKTIISKIHKGKITSIIIRQKISETRIEKELAKGKNNPNYGNGDKIRGENHWNWQNGKSFEIYPQEFNKELKQFILERDNYTCQDPNCDGNHKKLHVHHIDYNKKNNNPENLIILCISCHMKTNAKKKRNFFTELYQYIMINNIL